jgi:hypothetical protein
MAAVWFWAFRNPSALLALLCFATGALSVVEWGLALTGTTFFVIIADIGHHMGHRAKRRTLRRVRATRILDEAQLIRGRFAANKQSTRKRAA